MVPLLALTKRKEVQRARNMCRFRLRESIEIKEEINVSQKSLDCSHDSDLGRTNEDFGGPGRGYGGEAGRPYQNDIALHKILVLAKDKRQRESLVGVIWLKNP